LKKYAPSPLQIDQFEPLEPQITAIVDATNLASEERQTRPLLINRTCENAPRARGIVVGVMAELTTMGTCILVLFARCATFEQFFLTSMLHCFSMQEQNTVKKACCQFLQSLQEVIRRTVKRLTPAAGQRKKEQ
jgi:hypothetical protein